MPHASPSPYTLPLSGTGKSAKALAHGGCDRFGRDAEMLVKVFVFPRSPKSVHADEGAVRAKPAVPAETPGRLDPDPRRAAQYLSPVALVLRREQLPARQRHHRGA